MQTITFYSYKGGTGRTLVMANVASYLCRFGAKVFAVDFDLEAPGLLYKFRFPDGKRPAVERGAVDYVLAYQTEGQVPADLADYVLEVPTPSEPGSIHLMPAGACPSEAYWQKLAKINWYELFYSENPRGLSLLLDLKKRIEDEYQPDFLLIDSRTGITEIGGVAASVLPDKVVCLMLNNPENLEGAREVLRGIMHAPRMPDAPPIELLPILSRIPTSISSEEEESLKSEAKTYLNAQDESELSRTLSVDQVYVFHSEPELQVNESLRVGERKPEDSPLLCDYIRLFLRLIPSETMRPAVSSLVDDAVKRMLDAPEDVERDLVALRDVLGHPDVYRALSKFYQLRGRHIEAFDTAFSFRHVTGDTSEPFVWEAVRGGLGEVLAKASNEPGMLSRLGFASAVWLASVERDIRSGLEIAECCLGLGAHDHAFAVLTSLDADHPGEGKVVTRLIRALTGLGQYQRAFDLIQRYSRELAREYMFQIAWADLGICSGQAASVVGSQGFDLDVVLEKEPVIALRLLLRADRLEHATALLRNCMAQEAATTQQLGEIGAEFARLGQFDEFMSLAMNALPDAKTEEVYEIASELQRPNSNANE